MLSIIIPTLNEEKYLPRLFKSIKNQDFFDYEIIVADAGSRDNTVGIAKSFGCKITKGGLPAKGRNQGAKIAQGNLFLFLDADTALPEEALQALLKEFEKRKLDIANCWLRPFGENKLLHLGYDIFYNFPISILARWFCAGGGFLLIKKDLHQKIRGFDEEIRLLEDTVYCRKASQYGKFGVLRSVKIYFSQRRYQENGWIKTYLKIVLAFLHTIILGSVKSDIFKYRYGHYDEKKIK